MGPGTSNRDTQKIARITKPPKCSICLKTISEVSSCDWNQGRCPHMPSLAEQIMASPYKSRFYNIIKFFKGTK